ncbi:MAG: PAS domain S-box protein [Anaerolineae bacterium]|nr:PAS domain S-box protein [Anaerolineae bacterium]
MSTKWTSPIPRKQDPSIDIDRQMANWEPLVPWVLGIHGMMLFFSMSGTLWQWSAIAGVLLLAVWGSSRWGQTEPLPIIRAGLLLGLTWLLLLTTGGTGSPFLLWDFLLVTVYPIFLPALFSLLLIGAVPLTYLLLWPLSPHPQLFLSVPACAFLLFFLGWLTRSLKTTLLRYAHWREQIERRLTTAVELVGVMVIEFSVPFSGAPSRGEQWATLLGYKTEELPSQLEERVQWLIDHIHPDDVATTQHKYMDFIEGRIEEDHYERRMKHKSGRWIWVDGYTIVSERDKNGRPTRILSTMQDITHLKQTEQELMSIKNRLTGIIDSALDAIITIDAEQRIVLFNPSAEKMFGLPANEALGQTLDRLIPEQSQQVHRQQVTTFGQTRIANKPMTEQDYVTGRRATGEEFPIEASISQTRIEGQSLYTAILRDISERMQAEAQLHYQANLLENVSDAIIATDLNFVIQSWNKAAEKMYGLAAAEAVGKPTKDVLRTTFPEDNREALINQFRRNGWWQGEFMQYHKDGTPINILSSTTSLMDREDRPIGSVTVNRDITARKQAEEALQRSEQLLQLFVENAPAAIAMFDRDMYYMAASRRYMFDYDMKDDQLLIGRSVYEVLPEISGSERWQGVIQRCLAGTVEKAEEDTFRRANGKLEWVRWETRPWHEPSGEIGGIIFFFELITERKNLEEQYYQAQKMEAIGHLAGGIAHDFNNILVPIIGYAELGMMQVTAEEQLYTDLNHIRKAAERAANLTRQILAFSRKQVLQMHILDLNPLITDFQKMLQRLISETIILQTFLTPALYPVKADKAQLEQVLLNLAINARDAMPEGGTLTIETTNVYLDESYVQKHVDIQTPGHYAMLAVSDTGHGMAPQTQAQIFEPFFTTKDRGKGTGLGLSTVFGIVRQHQGHIWVYSEPGQGTTFKIYLPRAEETLSSPRATAITEFTSLSGTETILVVEDEEMVRKLACETLEAHGYRVLEAENVAHSLQLAAETQAPIDLMLTDVIMPGLNGRELYQQLLEHQPNMRVLYMSGYTDNIIVQHGILYEGVNFLQKPFTILGLLQKVRTVLAQDK